MAPRGLIFDFDGTLADTMPLHFEAWQTVARCHGFQFTAERFEALAGMPTRNILRQLGQEQGLELDPEAIVRQKEAVYLPAIHRVRPIERVVAIARAHQGHIPMAVASSGSRRVVNAVLDRLALSSLFQAVVTHEDVVRQKPAPDIFLEAARRLGVPPGQCRAYEDTDVGMQAIRAAGMEAVDVRVLLGAPSA